MHPFDRALVTGARDVEGIARLLAGLGLRVAPPPWPPLPLEPSGTLAPCRVAGGYEALGACVGPAPEASAADLARDVRRLAAATPGRRWLLIFYDPEFRWLTFVSPGVDGEVRRLEVRRHAPDAAALEALAEMVARPGDGTTALALRHARAMARGRITTRFFSEFRALRAALAPAWTGLSPRRAPPQELHSGTARQEETEAHGPQAGKREEEQPAPRGGAQQAGAPEAADEAQAQWPDANDRAELSLLLLCRLLFLHFLEARFRLDGDGAFLSRLLERWLAAAGTAGTAGAPGAPGARSFYRTWLEPLFRDALSTPPERRGPGARAEAFRHVPYLGGGLFARRPVERRHPHADLPDAAVTALFDGLFARYRFTAAETLEPGGPAGIDPEMLGRVFEGLMDPQERGRTGTFYTPRAVVRSLAAAALDSHLAAALADRRGAGAAAGPAVPITVHDVLAGRLSPGEERARVLAALREVRILDPAAGSGAFLLGALELLLELRRACGDPVDLATGVREALYGVDIKGDAVLLCMLRLWLALATAAAAGSAAADGPPLPNLDRRIRQGDALFDPLEFATGAFADVPLDAPSARALRRIEALRDRYLRAPEPERAALERELGAAERAVAVAVLDAAAKSLAGRLRELRHLASSRDLFGEPAARRRDLALAAELERRLADIQDLHRRCLDEEELPFFSFRLHFSEVFRRGGFDIVLTNPPWVRPHRWRASAGPLLRRRYPMLRRPAVAARAPGAGDTPRVLEAAGAQGDLSLAFLERSLELLRPGGTLAILLPAKVLRALYGAAARETLLARTTIVSVDDHALDQNAIFHADSFAAALVLRKVPAPPGHRVRVRVTRRGGAAAEFCVEQARLPARDEPGAPWALVPPVVAEALRVIQRSGVRLGDEFRIHRGVFTGANDVFILYDAQAKLGGIVRARARSGSESRPGAAGAAHGAEAHPADRAGGGGEETAAAAQGGSGTRVRSAPRRDRGRDHQAASWGEGVPRGSEAEPPGADPDPRHTGRGRPQGGTPGEEVHIEGRVLRRAVRGGGIRAWRFDASQHLLWLHGDGTPRPEPAPPLAAAYLERHRPRLEARAGARRRPPGTLFRVSPAVARPKVMWQDLAARPAAVYARDPVRCADGAERPVVPLNTVYFVVPPDDDAGYFLAALLNSRPVATYVRAVAERAKDARFRFLAWTLAALPLPAGWRQAPEARALAELSRRAHADRGLDESGDARLTELVARLYRLEGAPLAALLEWDRWLAEAL